MFSKVAIGVEGNGEEWSLAILSQRFGRLRVLDRLRVEGPQEQMRESVRKFLDKHRVREARVTACLPRRSLLVRFLVLPAEAEPQLAKVVGFQVDTFHPFKDGEVCWDCAVVSRDREKKQIKVVVALAERSRLEEHLQKLLGLGLRPASVTLTAACLAPLLNTVTGEAALVIFGGIESVEFLGFHQGNLCATQDVATENGKDSASAIEWGLHAVRSALPVTDPTAVPTYKFGRFPDPLSESLAEVSELAKPKLSWLLPSDLVREGSWPALGAAYVDLKRNSIAVPNVLPVERRWHAERRVPWLLYAMGSLAVLLAIAVGVQPWVERALYARALSRQIGRWQARADLVRKQIRETENLQARTDVLEGVRNQTWQKLRVLEDLTRILPNGTWLQEMDVDQNSVAISGLSDRAADLVKPLESSPYFSQVEFTSPITRGANNKEMFRIHMRLEKPVRP
jgi:Tfp pilus assembly protein PilN